jgi:dehydratase
VNLGTFAVPSSAGAVTIVDIKNVKVKMRVPANSSYVSCGLSGGSGTGAGKLTCSEKSGTVTFSAPGPIPGGTTVTAPTMTLRLKAGKSGSVESTMAGTSYSKPGLSATADLSVAGLPVTAKAVGYPNPNPVLTTTKIS